MKNIICLVFLLFPSLLFSQQGKKINAVKPVSVPIEMVYVKGGSFQMGSSYQEKNEKPVHIVKVSN